MTAAQIGKQTQQIADRLAAVDYAAPVIDRGRVEACVAEHFRQLRLPVPPVRWCPDAVEGLGYVRGAAESAAWGAAESAAWGAAWSAIRSAAESAARSAAWGAAEGAARSAAWGAAESAAWGAAWSADPKRYAEIWRPFLEALESGLWAYWVTEREFVAVPRPTIYIVGNRLHRADGPAVSWDAGARFYFWRGVQVTDQIIERPGELTGKQIVGERNAEVRRAIVERIGTSRFFKLIGNPKPIHRDGTGELYRVEFRDDPESIVAVHVTDPSTGRRYFLRVPPDTRHACQAVAWTFGMDENVWMPAVET